MNVQADMASVIHRKARVARDEFETREMSAPKALRLALAKAAAVQFDLALVVRMIEHEQVELPGIEEAVGEDGLLILLDGAEGPPGAIKLDLQFVTALIETQLMGELRNGEAPDRPFTQTDAAIAQPLMNAVLDGFSHTINSSDTVPDVDLYRFGDRVEDGRALALALSAPDYDLYRLNVDFGPGARTGVMELILPEGTPTAQAEDEAAQRALAAKLEENAMNSPVTLDAVLKPFRMPLDKVCEWAPGTVLPLSREQVEGARVLGAKGHVVARAHLGQLNGFRAVRLMIKTKDGDSDTTDVGEQGAGFAEAGDDAMGGAGALGLTDAAGDMGGMGNMGAMPAALPGMDGAEEPGFGAAPMPMAGDMFGEEAGDMGALPMAAMGDGMADGLEGGLADGMGDGMGAGMAAEPMQAFDGELPELPMATPMAMDMGDDVPDALALDAMVEEELARAAARFDDDDAADAPLAGGPSL